MNTNETKHTPVPWKYDDLRDQIFAANGSLICKVATGEDIREEHANARLIAAAPELLKQRDELLAVVGDCHTDKGALGYRNSEYAFRRLDAINAIVLAAIHAKATEGDK